jgi:hypothetical protein
VTLLKARGMRRTALDIGVSARLAARLQTKLEGLQCRLADPGERAALHAHLQDVRRTAATLERLRDIAEAEAHIGDHTLPDGRIVRR